MRPAGRQQTPEELWAETITVVAARVARVDRGESWAPAQVVRCLRVLVAPERAR